MEMKFHWFKISLHSVMTSNHCKEIISRGLKERRLERVKNSTMVNYNYRIFMPGSMWYCSQTLSVKILNTVYLAVCFPPRAWLIPVTSTAHLCKIISFSSNSFLTSFRALVHKVTKPIFFLSVHSSLETPAGGGGASLYGLYMYVQPQRVWFFNRFGHK